MSVVSDLKEEELDQKLKETFPKVIIYKKLAQLQEIKRLPRFVSEYLILKFCEEGATSENLARIGDFVRKHYPEKKEKHRIKTILMRTGSYELLDEFKVETDINRGIQKLIIPCLDITNGTVRDSLLYEHENLLIDGMWGIGSLIYVPESDNPVALADFAPFQVSAMDIESFRIGRATFTLNEWVDILINSIGLNPARYDFRSKLIYLSRMIPLVEPNVNMIELGPKGTGKTFLFRNVSYYSRVISGGQITPATLFVNLSTNRHGLLAVKDCVVFDEISTVKFSQPGETIGKLKDYMESGNFDRGTKQVHSSASIIMVGNLPIQDGKPSVELYFEFLPNDLKESAFLDRFNGFIPGWNLTRIQESDVHLSKNMGFVSDYLAEALHKLRFFDFSSHVSPAVKFENADIRDEKSIKKVASGMLKILFPHEVWDINGFKLCLDFAIEYRQRIINQLHLIDPGEFKKKTLGYRLRSEE